MTQQAAYEREQAELKRQRGEDDEDDIRIEAPKPHHAEVNPEIFKDVKPLLARGFLHVPAVVNDVPFVFKSLNHHEFELVRFQSIGTGRLANRRQYNTFLAYGVLMVDGINVLVDRENYIPQLAEVFDSLPEGARERVVYYMSEINRRADRATALTEAYLMEGVSRLRWAQVKGMNPTCTAATGFRGTETLGMNWGQLAWRALNYYEDKKELAEREWENAKFVASAMAGKGMSKVHNQDKRRREDEMNERYDRRDKVIRQAVFGEDPEETSKDNVAMTVARSVEELSDQLEKDLRGEQDWHDRVVSEHERRVQEGFTARATRLAELQKAHQTKFGERSLVGATDLKGLTPDEVQFRIERRRQITAQKLSAQQVYPELLDPKMAKFHDKWNQIPVSSRDPKEVAPVVVANRPTGVPFKRGDK